MLWNVSNMFSHERPLKQKQSDKCECVDVERNSSPIQYSGIYFWFVIDLIIDPVVSDLNNRGERAMVRISWLQNATCI